jgi:hypothetical protein
MIENLRELTRKGLIEKNERITRENQLKQEKLLAEAREKQAKEDESFNLWVKQIGENTLKAAARGDNSIDVMGVNRHNLGHDSQYKTCPKEGTFHRRIWDYCLSQGFTTKITEEQIQETDCDGCRIDRYYTIHWITISW